MKLEDVQIDMKVRYHPVIGGKHDGNIWTVRATGMLYGREVAWLKEKPGAVAAEALSVPVGESTLNFAKLRQANLKRCEQSFHPITDWNPAEWACAMAGEAGEACNVAKKIKRIETGTNTAKDPQTLAECRTCLAKELADTVIYADLLAARLDIDLGEAIREKFNEVSRRMHSDVKL